MANTATGKCFMVPMRPRATAMIKTSQRCRGSCLDGKFPQQSRALRQAMILRGIDFNGARALVGTCHTDEVVEDTLNGFAEAVKAVKEEGLT